MLEFGFLACITWKPMALTLVKEIQVEPYYIGFKQSLVFSEFSSQIAALSAWIFFVLIHAYYGGSLTSYFSTSPGLPFSSVEEGLGLYPTWKLLTISGEEGPLLVLKVRSRFKTYDEFCLQAKAIEEPMYANYLKMLKANPNEFQAKDHRDGMERLKSDGNFLRTTKEAFNAMVKYLL